MIRNERETACSVFWWGVAQEQHMNKKKKQKNLIYVASKMCFPELIIKAREVQR